MKFPTHSLKGLKVLNTRPVHQLNETSKAIQAAGGIPIELPLLEINPTRIDWQDKLPLWSELTDLIFISKPAVKFFFVKQQFIDAIKGNPIQTWAIGHATGLAVQAHLQSMPIVPEVENSEHLLLHPKLQAPLNKRNILLIKGKQGRRLISDTLIKRGAHLYESEVYERVCKHIKPDTLYELWKKDGIDVTLITSVTGLKHLFQSLPSIPIKQWLCKKPMLVLSHRIMMEAQSYGVKDIKMHKTEKIKKDNTQ